MIRLRALGECAMDIGAERLGPEAELAFALLLVLVLADGRRISRRQVVDLLWPATSEERARHNLRQTIYKLRQLGVPVDSAAGHVRLAPQVVDAALVVGSAPDDSPPTVLLRPDQPFGEFLAGYAPRFSAPYAAWVEEQRGLVHARLRRALLALLADERRRGNWGAVETLARKCLKVDPLNEEATMALAEATALSGSKRAALALLDGYLREIGPDAGEMRLPAAVLRRRIAERLPAASSFAAAPDCFVGREASVAFLRERLRPVLDGKEARSVLLWGEEGMGKSRLVAEFTNMAELDGARVARVASQARDLERPLSAFVDLVPLLQALPGALGCSPESVENLKRLTDHDPAMLEPSAATREAELLFASVRRALFDLVDAVAEEAPLVICIEDTHWLDERSWRVTRELVGWLAKRPLLLLLTSRISDATPHRPERPAPWLESHRLPPLSRSASTALFSAVAGASAPPAAYRDWAVHMAAGNPFFVRALASHWAETGELRAPTSLEELVRERVARLSGRALRVLQACATLGKHATLARLEAVLEYPRHELLDSAAELEEGGFLMASGPAVPCRHDLIARAALDQLPEGTLRLLHRCAGEVLEREVLDARSAALLWDCAQQWQAAGERARALALVRSTAAHLLEVGLPTEAAEAYERALELCETDEEQAEMSAGLTRALVAAGLWARVVEVTSRLVTHKMSSTNPLGSYNTEELLLIEARWRCAEPADVLIAETYGILTNRERSPHIRVLAALLGLALSDNACDEGSFHKHYQEARQMYFGPGVEQQTIDQIELIYHTCKGDLSHAVTIARTLSDSFRQVGNEYQLAKALRFASWTLRRSGNFAEAEHALREALGISQRLNHSLNVLNTLEALVQLKLETDANDEATWWFNLTAGIDSSIPDPTTRASLNCLRARILLHEGRVDEAFQELRGVSTSFHSDPTLRRRATVLAVTADVWRYSDLLSSPAGEDLVSSLATTLERASSWGGQDYNVLTLTRCLKALNQNERAAKTVATYLSTERRETYDPPSELVQAADAVV